jgi:hypothetical protein
MRILPAHRWRGEDLAPRLFPDFHRKTLGIRRPAARPTAGGLQCKRLSKDGLLPMMKQGAENILKRAVPRSDNSTGIRDEIVNFTRKGSVLLLLTFVVAMASTPFAEYVSERDRLIRRIKVLDAKAKPGGWKYTMAFEPIDTGVKVTMTHQFQNEPASTQDFVMPGPYTFEPIKGSEGDYYSVAVKAKESWNLSSFDEATAIALASALTELNSLRPPKK